MFVLDFLGHLFSCQEKWGREKKENCILEEIDG